MVTNKWTSPGKPLILGHRGASADMPENTLAAFGLAMDQGADGLELDVRLAADGRVVICHDHVVDRISNGSGKIAAMTVAELQTLDLGQEQTIPTLDELFEMLGPQILYNIELKSSGWRDSNLATAVADRVAAYHLQNHVLISSFNPIDVRRARQAFPSATPVALIRMRGLLRYTYLLTSGEADHPHHTMVDENYMVWARRRGYLVNTWTVDDPQTAQRLADLGVDGIITNKPAVIRAAF